MTADSTCGCGCGGAEPATPVSVFNPPGQAAIGYRVGEYGGFLQAMLDRLSGPAYPALRDLTVRTPDDPAIALLDAWAVLGDLLTFYSERIANEGYLRTATEESSLALLGRLVGHRPRPGVAAGTYLAYSLDRDPRTGQEAVVTIPRGARAQSVPGPGEEPQSFESDEDLPARAAWNELPVRQRRPYQLTAAQLPHRTTLHATGTANNVKPGDQLLFVFSAEKTADSSQRVLLTVPGVTVDRDTGTTVIALPGPELRSLKNLLDELQLWITPGDQDTPNPWPDGSRIVDTFDDEVLSGLRADLDRLTTPSKLAERLTETLERLREAKEFAHDYPDVLAWFEALEAELATLQAQARVLEPPQPDTSSLAAGLRLLETPADGGTAVPAALRGLGALLGPLRTAPARLPADARRLDRDPDRIYAAGSDLGPQLLSALDPRLSDDLYAAWRNTDLTAPLALRELQAMRVTATPFGATAPLKPVYDAQGRVTRYDDWPLTGTRLASLRIGYDSDGTAPRRADFTYVEGGGSVQQSFALPGEDGAHDFGPGGIVLTTTEPDPGPGAAADADEEFGVTVKLLPDLPERTVFVSRPAAESGLIHVTIGDVDPVEFQLAPGDEPDAVTQGEFTVTVSRAASGDVPDGEGASVKVAFSSQLRLSSRKVIALDAVYEGIAPGSWVAVQRPRKGVTGEVPGDPGLALVITRVSSLRVLSRADFGITGKVTQLTLEDDWLDDQDTLLAHIRDATVHARGDTIRLADEPVTDDVHGDRIELDGLQDGLAPGRWIIVSGERTDIPGTPGVRGSELAMIAGVEQSVDPALPGDTVHTTLQLTSALAHSYRRDAVTIHGNVVRASHGASRDEPIGSGDAGKAGQTFTLWQGPLTWLASDTPSGATGTLRIRVDGVLWHETDSLAGRGPRERIYVTGLTDDGRTTVTFGDGVHGSRLPTGHENVRAEYRVGIGRAANVGAESITQLTTRPLGVSAVTNPLPATGGSDPDGPGLARRNIPLAVAALDRLVSVPDYEDFTRARAGIGRASAVKIHDGAREVVHLTVAGVDDIALTDDSGLLRALRAALAEQGDPRLAVRVAVREQVLLVIAASVKVLPDYSWDLVEPKLRAALLARLGYPARELGQPAHLSEVLAAAQAVPGVDYIDVDAFAGVPGSLTPAGLEHLAEQLRAPLPVVESRLARYDEERYRVTREGGETLTEIAAAHGISIADLLRLNPGITGTRPLPQGRSVVVFRGIRPAQLAVLSPDLPDTLILKEATS
ncbi:putative baseplate assembly protein [Streptomyces sp. NBC_01262]|uniref:putative baseplate assembly protein n=1 Tax=Streptomyces sp. NBC_01262 TaxID=2903803 RepID=UPI002E37E9EB|nr:putative baseplate assembly protein [Streptomyces sp. NBC_01262]